MQNVDDILITENGERGKNVKFWKMNGAGNDFIILDNRTERIPAAQFPELARTLCERRLSLGADGLMVVETAERGGDYKMLFFNSDGSLGEMCGNGARCICRYGYENALAGDIQRVETTAGMVTGYRLDSRNYRIRLNDPGVVRLEVPVEVDGMPYLCAYVELGSPGLPHIVLPIRNLRDADRAELASLGRKLRFHRAFPKGANVNFYELIGQDRIYLCTYERGVEDFTYACGTGTASTALVLALQGLTGRCVTAEMRGGTLCTEIDLDGKKVKNLWLTGPTNIVAKGELTDENMNFNM